jgi:hypothetical protein
MSQGYLVGDPGAVCWKTANKVTTQITCPGSTTIEFLSVPAQPFYSDKTYNVKYKFTVDKCKLTNGTVSAKGGFEVPHANIHSCIAHLGACTPFVGNTPGLATHTPAIKGNLVEQARRGCIWTATFESPVHLAPHSYTMLAHGRFFDDAGTVKYDVAFGKPLRVQAPTVDATIDSTAMAVLGVLTVIFWLALTSPSFYLLYTQMSTLEGEALEESIDLMIELFCEGLLDAVELGSSLLILSTLEGTDMPTFQWVLITFVVLVVISIIGNDVSTVYVLCGDGVELQQLGNTRRLRNLIIGFMIVTPLSGLEVQNYLDNGKNEDLVTVFILAVDVGFRIKSSVDYLRSKYRPVPKQAIESTAPPAKVDFEAAELAAGHTDTQFSKNAAIDVEIPPGSQRGCC